MATGKGVDQGKTRFVESYLRDHPGAKLEDVNQAWTSAGNGRTISGSLYYKQRGKRQQDGEQGGEPGDEAAGKSKPGPKAKEKRREPSTPPRRNLIRPNRNMLQPRSHRLTGTTRTTTSWTRSRRGSTS